MRASQLTENDKPDAFDILASQYKWVTAAELKSAIKLLSNMPTTDIKDWELDIREILTDKMLRDLSGAVGDKSIIMIDGYSSSSDAKENGEFEFYVFNQHDSIGTQPGMFPNATTSYFSYTNVLQILKLALSNIKKQSLPSLRADMGVPATQTQAAPAPAESANKLKNTRTYKKIQKEVLAQFVDEVIDIFPSVNGTEPTMELSVDPEYVFANALTDALFYAWTMHVSFPAIHPGCVYDYLRDGDKTMLV